MEALKSACALPQSQQFGVTGCRSENYLAGAAALVIGAKVLHVAYNTYKSEGAKKTAKTALKWIGITAAVAVGSALIGRITVGVATFDSNVAKFAPIATILFALTILGQKAHQAYQARNASVDDAGGDGGSEEATGATDGLDNASAIADADDGQTGDEDGDV
ncbi:hypothetical protein K0U07_00400 [bacterium]|nr:hypothetical protein [bacterium]